MRFAGPVLGLIPLGDDLDAHSFGIGIVDPQVNFSTRPGALGIAGTPLSLEATCAPGEVHGDEWSVQVVGNNVQRFDEDGLSCAGNLGVSFGLIVSDDVNALDEESGVAIDFDLDGVPNVPVYFSLEFGSATLGLLGVGPAAILVSGPGAVPIPGVFAPAGALEMFENGNLGYDSFDPIGNPLGDIVIFSLSAGSPTLGLTGASPGDLLSSRPIRRPSSGGLPRL